MANGSQVLYTAEEFGRRADPGYPEELIRGRIGAMPPPGSRHGQGCNKIGRIVGNYADEHDLGHVLSNDSGVITEREPDTVRGADVCFYSYERVPKGPLPPGYLDVPPDIIFEVLFPEAKRRQRIRRLTIGLAALLIAAGVASALVISFGGSPPRARTVGSVRSGGANPVAAGAVMAAPQS